MPVSIADLNEQFLDSTRRLTAAIHQLDKPVAEINVALRFIKWLGVFFATCAVGGLVMSYYPFTSAE